MVTADLLNGLSNGVEDEAICSNAVDATLMKDFLDGMVKPVVVTTEIDSYDTIVTFKPKPATGYVHITYSDTNTFKSYFIHGAIDRREVLNWYLTDYTQLEMVDGVDTVQ